MTTEPTTETRPAFVAHDTCGCAIGVTHAGKREDDRTIAEWVREGYIITRMTVAESRKVDYLFTCPEHVR